MTTIGELRDYLAHCEEKATGTLPVRQHQHGAYIYPFTRQNWDYEARVTREGNKIMERAEAVRH